jgi:hypothetical protein
MTIVGCFSLFQRRNWWVRAGYIYMGTDPWLAVLRKIKDLGFDLFSVGLKKPKNWTKNLP